MTLPETKNSQKRIVPLSSVAISIFKDRPGTRRLDGKVRDIGPDAISQDFAKACRNAGRTGCHFRDLRHEATSQFFEKGLNPMQVAAITEHKTLQMLKRYTHLKAEELAELLKQELPSGRIGT